ncbi:MAG: GlsB/YeaQ/YmgE family stress response membrane protein [Betaproteobacteria bacterium]|nr:GlsB/YeaQ/YmgE family stress response membrane protein [Betaproteobacteria bacterium]
MNMVMWILAGGILGWLGYTALGANADRGLVVSIIIGMVGGFFGGDILAPMFGGAGANPGDFSPFALFIAAASAAGCLTISNLIHNRYGV